MSDKTKGILCAATAAVCWAILALVLKYALTFVSAPSIAGSRMIIASIGMLLLLLITKPQSLKALKRPPLLAILAGLLLAFNYYGYMQGIDKTTASNVQIMIQIGPLTLALIGIFYFKEIPTLKQLAGFCVASLGFLLFYWDQIQLALQSERDFAIGNAWTVAAAFAWALFATFQKKIPSTWSPNQVNLIIYVSAAVGLLGVVQWHEFAPLNAFQWVIVLSLGLNTLIAYGALAFALKLIPASLVSLIIAANPLLTIFCIHLLEVLNLSFIPFEPLEWKGFLGASFVVTGVALTVIKRKKLQPAT